MSGHKPKISILTPSFNQDKYIEENILSVMNQNYENFEHIIVDGGSTDNTVEILKKYPHLKWVSEKDGGQSDALNKGLKMASGEIIGWINSDDYYEKDIFFSVANEFADDSVKWIIGNTIFIYESIGWFRNTRTEKTNYETLLGPKSIVRQQGTFFRKSFVKEAGSWDKKMKMWMDLDLWIRMAKLAPPKMINKNYAYFRWHEHQKSSFRNTQEHIREFRKIYKREEVNILIQCRTYFRVYKTLLKSILKHVLVKINLIDKKYLYAPYFGSKK